MCNFQDAVLRRWTPLQTPCYAVQCRATPFTAPNENHGSGSWGGAFAADDLRKIQMCEWELCELHFLIIFCFVYVTVANISYQKQFESLFIPECYWALNLMTPDLLKNNNDNTQKNLNRAFKIIWGKIVIKFNNNSDIEYYGDWIMSQQRCTQIRTFEKFRKNGMTWTALFSMFYPRAKNALLTVVGTPIN